MTWIYHLLVYCTQYYVSRYLHLFALNVNNTVFISLYVLISNMRPKRNAARYYGANREELLRHSRSEPAAVVVAVALSGRILARLPSSVGLRSDRAERASEQISLLTEARVSRSPTGSKPSLRPYNYCSVSLFRYLPTSDKCSNVLLLVPL